MKQKRMGLFVLLIVLSLLLSACGGSKATSTSPTPESSVAPASNSSIDIVGAGLDLNFSMDQLKAREHVDLHTTNIDSKGEVATVDAKGISLTAILKENGVEQKSLEGVTFSAFDGYSMAVPKDILKARELYILFELNGKPLDTPRSSVPEERAMYWVRDLNKIELSTQAATTGNAKKIVLFKTGAATLKAETLNNKGDKVQSTSLDQFSKTYLKAAPTGSVAINAGDLKKTEKAEVFLSCYITYEGEDAPLFFSETLADGMRVKHLSTVQAGDEVIYFGQSTVSMKDLLKLCNMGDGKNFDIVGSDGFKLTVTQEQLQKGSLEFKDGGFTATIPGVSKAGGQVKNVLSIAIAD